MKLAFVGDIAFFGKFDLKNSDVIGYFSDVKKILDECDYRIGNLEAPFVSEGKKSGNKSAYISSTADNVRVLNSLNINAVSLANNHVYDFGNSGVTETINVLEKNNIDWFGIKNKDLIVKESKLAFHGYCSYNTNPVGLKSWRSKLGVEPLNYLNVVGKFKKYSEDGYFNIVSVHSGVEHVNLASKDDISFARALSEIDNYIYYGHHPHVLQGVEEYNNSALAYSLGNFCFDDVYDELTSNVLVKQSDNNKSSIILIVTLNSNKIESVKKVGIFQGESKMLVHHKDALRISDEADSLLNLSSEDYLSRRQSDISTAMAVRNSKRDLNWFLSRLSLQTLCRVIERRVNEYKYKKYFSSKLD